MPFSFDQLLDWIAPRRCLGCDEPGRAPWCASCIGPEALDASPLAVLDVPLLVCGAYAGALACAIRRFKYNCRPDLARPLAALLTTQLRKVDIRPITWVPVPLHPERLAERGFNQSALLARALARATHSVDAPRLLARTRATEHQARLERAAREENMRGAIVVRRTPPRDVVLVDDVVTSGATVSACIEALVTSGSRVRAVVALAHTPP